MKAERSKSSEWWSGTATHMWRTFFSLENNGFNWNKLSEPDRKFYAVCNDVFIHEFVPSDQNILRMYFSSRWGDDRYAVEDYSAKNNIPTTVIWMVVRRAKRVVMVKTGFLEDKEDRTDG